MLKFMAVATSLTNFFVLMIQLYDIFGKYGAIFQIRLGDRKDTRGTAYVCFEDIYDAKSAVDHLSGFNVCGRYLVVLYYQPEKLKKKAEAQQKQKEIEELRRQIQAKKIQMESEEQFGVQKKFRLFDYIYK